jgi:hypothetical protein
MPDGRLMGGAMLPDIRAVIAALFAAVGLLMIAFGAVAMFRVAQDSHGAVQADLAKRGRSAPPPLSGQQVTVVDTPGPHIAPFPPLPVVEVKDAPIADIRDAPSPIADAPPAPPADAATPPAEPRIGGPLAEAKPGQAERAAKHAAAKKARAVRLARERKAAARRAAQARAKQQQPATPSGNSFGNYSFGAGAAKQ